MASPGELVSVVAESLGLDTGTVLQYDRILSEAGLRSKSGRGRSAASVNASDAAHLLIAVCGAPLASTPLREAVKTTLSYAKLPAEKRQRAIAPFKHFGFDTIASLPTEFTFGDALTALVESLTKGEGGDKWFSFDGSPLLNAHRSVTVSLAGPFPSAKILIDEFGGRVQRRMDTPALSFSLEEATRKQLKALHGDLKQEVRFSHKALLKIAKLLSQGSAE